MRNFKSKVLSAYAWAAPVLAAVVPSQYQLAQPRGQIFQIEHQDTYAQATFSVPCTGCLGSDHTGLDDESLILNFRTYGHDQECGASNITLNGVFLPQEWDGDFASGSASHNYTGVANLPQDERSPQHDLDLEWNSACLHGIEETDETAQVLTVNIKAVDGKPIEVPAGFTISFNQLKQHKSISSPSLLRLATVPNPLASDSLVAESWRSPPLYLRLYSPDAPADGQTVESLSERSLQADIRELQALQSELRELQYLVTRKSISIQSRLRSNHTCFKDEVKKCKNVSCVVKAVANKAHGAWRDIVVHLHFDQQRHAAADMNRLHFAPAHAQSMQKDGGHIQTLSSEAQPQPYEAPTNELPPRPPRKAPYVIALEITLSVLCCGCLIATIRHKCASLRTKTERAADFEERINARAYARAARQHAWRNWWRGNWRRNRDSERIADYEEKRALISAQEDVLEDAMQEEIRQLRVAHNVVNDLVRDAEEGRMNRPPQCNCQRPPDSPSATSTYPPTSLPEVPSRPLSRTDSLPSYRSDPPAYESEGEVVANGFNFLPNARQGVVRGYARSTNSEMSRWTPDSSVVDVSPRPSAETLRSLYPLSELTSDDEE
ncbi:hypothetical protein P153DRAFT_55139 [Dothidotthia symphoricarpi CBS 119687]|uniref:Uncharacterized protein n=1 Tax=Dothidotthia symphoricarpi CBS 119687 TaxID=1392245 RepID=A0A6A6A7G0_9PLEO|nr:uncharacterized protein P153DRAFT_55139 [Dothidotthia symphoricarpi CBS 119687]KAF2127770.1 hypothetical protein P153DRAFT_55139 [Dothidotthia symphoricarpi CBS 119687]